MVKKDIIELINQRFYKIKPKDLQASGCCLIWTIATILEVMPFERVILQAGTCLWPRVNKDQDDGICLTHFGYQWDPTTVKPLINLRLLPEMHVWAAIPETQTIIDMTTGFFPERALDMLRIDWPGNKPPKYFWGQPHELPENVIYKPELKACLLADELAGQFVKEHLMKSKEK